MRGLGALFWIAVVVIAGTTNFMVKHVVQNLDDELANVRRKTIAEQKEIHALNADWAYLNQPELLADLNRRFLGLVPIAAKQLQRTIEDVPLLAAPPLPAPLPTIEPQTVAALAMPAENPGPTPALPAPPPTALLKTAGDAAAPKTAQPPTAPGPPQRPHSLDALFAQVAGDR